MTFHEKFYSSNVQSVCVRYGFCTKMTNEEYDDLLAMPEHVGMVGSLTDVIEIMAQHIFNKSDEVALGDASPATIAGILWREAVVRFVED